MNKFQKTTAAITAMLSVLVILFTSCKKDFENPPYQTDPAIAANTSIKDLKAMHTVAGAYNTITTNIIISGVVVADDKSGNLYKQIYIEDSTGGLQINLAAANLYGTYPVGRRVVIKCNGLTLTDYHNTMQLGIKSVVNGIPSEEGIPSPLIQNYVIGGSLNNPVVPHVVTYAQLGTSMSDQYIGRLIQLDDYQFQATDTSKTYADTGYYKNSVDLYAGSCATPASQIDVRSSGYANFAGTKVSNGHGSLIGIYAPYNTTKQLIIRDLNDVRFNSSYGCPLAPGTLLFQDFEGIGANNLPLTLPSGWKNIGETGGVLYQNAVFGTAKCAKISAFGTGVAAVTSWLITPSISLTGATAPKLTFMSAAGYTLGATTFDVLISTNYAGGNNPSASTWATLPATISPGQTTGYAPFISSGTVNIPVSYIGQNIYIAFKYTGSDPTKTTTYEVDDIKVTAL